LGIYEISFAIIGGFIAGCVNTLAGNGSVITLGFLTEVMLLPGNVANGTNRIGIITQGALSLQAFYKSGKIPFAFAQRYLIWGIFGAIFGMILAIKISSDGFITIYKYLLLALFAFMILQGKKVIHTQLPEHALPAWIYIPVFFGFGFYGGFIQMGMGIFILAFMIFYMKFPLIEANALKIVMVTTYTGIALPLFSYYGMVNWKIGLTIAIGQGLGGWITAHFSSRSKHVEVWAYRFLLFIMIITLLKLFGLLNWLFHA
jgi:uncharacterized membrane protein YfcA